MKTLFNKYPHANTNYFNTYSRLYLLGIFLIFVSLTSCTHRLSIPLQPYPNDYYENKITFTKDSSKEYPKSNIQDIKIYKSTNHLLGQSDLVRSNENPTGRYEIIGTLIFQEDWYYQSTLDYLIKKKVAEVGGDAILEYQTYQTQAAAIKRQDNGKIETLYFMKIKATVIKLL